MKREAGKMTFLSLVAVAILALGGFMAYKYIGSNLERKQIKKEVFDTVGIARGSSLEEASLTEVIEGVLAKHDVEVLDAGVETQGGMIRYYFSYSQEVNYLFFKRTETVEVSDEMDGYGG